MMQRFKLRHGQTGRLVFDFVGQEGGVPELVGALLVYGQSVPLVVAGAELLVPVVPPGWWLMEVRAGGATVLYGQLEVQPSPLGAASGEVAWSVAADMTQEVAVVHVELSEGPQGEKGERGEQGPQGEKGERGVDGTVILPKNNTWTGTNTFVNVLHALPLGATTALGAPAYGLSVSADGGLQLWGTHFLQGDAHADTTLKIVHNSLSLGSTDTAAIGFDYANIVTFRTFPNDGSTANDNAGGVYRFEAWRWADDSHTSKEEMAVDVRKPNAGTLCDESLMNRAEVLAAIEENAGGGSDLPLAADTRISATPPTVSTSGAGGMALGYGASAIGVASTALGVDASADGTGSVAIGRGAKTLNGDNSVSIGHQANAKATSVNMYTTAVGAETLADSDNATALGAKASAKASATAVGAEASAKAKATAVGTKAQATGTDSTALGYNAKASGTVCSTALGQGASASGSSATALGSGAIADANGATAVGRNARANAKNATALGCFTLVSSAASTAVGYSTQVNDIGVTAIGNFEGTNAQYQTLLYLIGANSPLATTYEGGAASLGYVVKDTNGNIIECGTRKLSELLTNNTAFAPASMDLDAPAPTPFMPTGITDPIEFPEELENDPEILTDTTQQ